MSLRNEESPWAILDPALKKPKFFEENSEQAKQNTYLDYTLPLPETNKIKKEAIDKKKESDLVPTLFEEIEDELMHHRYDIYIEKLNTFKKQLISIEKETHKEIIKSDKKALAKVQEDLSQIEAFYQYQLDALERDIATEKSNILHEHKKSLELTRKIIALEKNNISNQPSIKKKRRRSESEEERKRKWHLQQEISKMQAKLGQPKKFKGARPEDSLDTMNEKELEHDLLLIKQQIQRQK